MSRLPTPGSDANNWGTLLNDYLQQALASDGKLVTTATNAFTGLANTNLASGSNPGIVQLAGDLTGTASSPALTSVISAGSVGSGSAIPVLTYDAKGRITAVSTASVSGGYVSSFSIDGGNSATVYTGTLGINFGGSV